MRLAHRFVRSPLAACGVWAAALVCMPAAQAQVNKCHIDGQLVVRSTPCPLEPRAAAAPASAAVTSVTSRKKTLADVLRERDAASPQRPVTAEAQGDGANVLRSRMGAG